MTSARNARTATDRPLIDAERPTFFTDAVVAIAMTLLILPLLESVADAGRERLTAGEWWHDHAGQVGSFVLSFVLIATFWMNHRALFEHVAMATARLLWLNVAWMLMIVWLPVATAMVGSPMSDDRLRFGLYVAPLVGASVLALIMYRLVLAHPDLWKGDTGPDSHGLAITASLTVLYGLALIIGLLLPGGTRYFVMALLFLVGPLERIMHRRLA